MAANIHMRVPTHQDVLELCERMRPPDRVECIEGAGRPLLAVVDDSIRACDRAPGICASVFFDGELAAIWGVAATRRPGVGVIWMLTTDTVNRHPKTFLRYSQLAIGQLRDEWDSLVNAVDVRNVASIRWLTRLGARWKEAAPHGPNGKPFRRFDLPGRHHV